MASKKYKKVYKGVRYVTSALQRYYPNKYATKKDASAKAHEIVSQLKSTKTKVTIKNAFGLLPKRELKPKTSKPILSEELLKKSNYWELHDYPTLIESLLKEPEIYFESNIIPAGLEDLVGGYEYSYEEYFSKFVKHIEKSRKQLKEAGDNDPYNEDWFVRCTEPIYNKNTKHWVSKIISCENSKDNDKDENNYGFDPNNPEFSIMTDIPVRKDKKSKATEQPKEIETKSELSEQITLEKEKQKTAKEEQRASIFKLLEKGIITKAEFDSHIKRLDS